MNKTIILILAISYASIVFGQDQNDSLSKQIRVNPSIPIEFFATKNNLSFQMLVNKHFSENSRFGFFNITSFVGDYKTTNQRNSYQTQSFITADIWKGLSVNAGVVMNSETGFRPSAGLRYIYGTKNLVAILLPRFDLTQTYNFETFGLVEYTPKFKNNWGLYSRIQGLYNQNTKQNNHERSYIWLRLGASYKNYQFGLGSNFDFYGPFKINENNVGVFVRADL